MEKISLKNILIAILILLIILGAWLGWEKWSSYRVATRPMNLEIAYTPQVEGVVKAPEGMPSDLPVETEDVLESITTQFPEQGAVQFSYTYRSKLALTAKAEEYRVYLEKAGYELQETSANNSLTFEGSKEGSKFSIVLTPWGDLTLVQIAYLAF